MFNSKVKQFQHCLEWASLITNYCQSKSRWTVHVNVCVCGGGFAYLPFEIVKHLSLPNIAKPTNKHKTYVQNKNAQHGYTFSMWGCLLSEISYGKHSGVFFSIDIYVRYQTYYSALKFWNKHRWTKYFRFKQQKTNKKRKKKTIVNIIKS